MSERDNLIKIYATYHANKWLQNNNVNQHEYQATVEFHKKSISKFTLPMLKWQIKNLPKMEK